MDDRPWRPALGQPHRSGTTPTGLGSVGPRPPGLRPGHALRLQPPAPRHRPGTRRTRQPRSPDQPGDADCAARDGHGEPARGELVPGISPVGGWESPGRGHGTAREVEVPAGPGHGHRGEAVTTLLVEAAVADGGTKVSGHLSDQDGQACILALSHHTTLTTGLDDAGASTRSPRTSPSPGAVPTLGRKVRTPTSRAGAGTKTGAAEIETGTGTGAAGNTGRNYTAGHRRRRSVSMILS